MSKKDKILIGVILLLFLMSGFVCFDIGRYYQTRVEKETELNSFGYKTNIILIPYIYTEANQDAGLAPDEESL